MPASSPSLSSQSLVTEPAGAPVGFEVRRIPLDAPWEWLARGWRDLCAMPVISLLYGGIVTALAWGLIAWLSTMNAEALLPVFAAGYALVAPVLAAGLYQASRLREAGETVTFQRTFDVSAQTHSRLAYFGILLLLGYFVWMLVAFLLLMLFLGTSAVPEASKLVHTLLFTGPGLGLLLTGTAVGALIAFGIFSISTVAVPLLLERDVDAVSALVTSVRAVSFNLGPMMLWAGLIAGFVVLGMLTLFAGLVIAFPLLGYATWHAYRELVPSAGT
jgi:uncharacterized membrane protein